MYRPNSVGLSRLIDNPIINTTAALATAPFDMVGMSSNALSRAGSLAGAGMSAVGSYNRALASMGFNPSAGLLGLTSAHFMAGRSMSHLSENANYAMDPSYSFSQFERYTANALSAPGALFKNTLKANTMLFSLPRLGAIMAGVGTGGGNPVPFGLRTLLSGTKGAVGSRMWGMAAGTVMSGGNPLWGALMASPLGAFARGDKVFGFNLGTGGVLNVFDRVADNLNDAATAKNATRTTRTASKAVNKSRSFLDNLFSSKSYSEELSGRISKFTVTGTTKSSRLAHRIFGTRSNPTVDSTSRIVDLADEFIKGEQPRTRRLVREFLGQMDPYDISFRESWKYGLRNRNLAEDVSTISSTSKKFNLTGNLKDLKSQLIKEGFSVKQVEDIVKRGEALKTNIGFAATGLDNITNSLMRSLTVGSGGIRGLASSTFGIMGMPFKTIGALLKMGTGDIFEDYQIKMGQELKKVKKELKASKFGEKIDKTTRMGQVAEDIDVDKGTFRTTRRSTTASRLGVTDKIDDIFKMKSTASMVGRVGLYHIGQIARYRWIRDIAKETVGNLVNAGVRTVQQAITTTKNIGRMEFGTGQTLDTMQASTERSRAIQAMQNVGISARSYLGQEAAIRAEGIV
jgi:hypothetical protein